MPDHRIPKQTLFGWLPESRPQGGPRRRWRDLIRRDLKTIEVEEELWYSEATTGWRATYQLAMEDEAVKQHQRRKLVIPDNRQQVKCDVCGRSFRRESDKEYTMKNLVIVTIFTLLSTAASQLEPGTGTLNFLNLASFSSLFRDDELSSNISTLGGFPFGRDTVYDVYVSTNGFISMGVRVDRISPGIPGTSSIVAPYAADIDPTEAGTVRYTQFTTDDYSQMSTVSSFIRAQTDEYFYGTAMMVAEWDGVAEYDGVFSITSTFQCVLITDGYASYAVFIYECGGMEWDGATIGWEYDDSLYQRHPFSGSNSADVGCAYSSSYSAIVYQLDSSGTLNFLTLTSFSSLFGDDEVSSNVSAVGGFPFGRDTVYNVYVSTNGFISMGVRVNRISPEIPGTSSIVAPYAADIDPTEAGTVRYTQFTTDDYSQMSTVSSFIQARTDEYFYGTTMMVAEWNGVPEYAGSPNITSTFQCVLITNSSVSYAVFIYECGGMEWDGATIGWQYDESLYQRHYISGSNSSDVGCAYSSSYSAVVYRLDSSAVNASCPQFCGMNENCSIYTNYECECLNGFTDEYAGYCEDINECERGYCDSLRDGYCYNTPGSYECYCEDGYYRSYVINQCIPIDIDVLRYEPSVYEDPDGCDPYLNQNRRDGIKYTIQELIGEYICFEEKREEE